MRQEIVTTSLLVGLVVGGSRQRHTWWTRRFVRQVDLAEEEEQEQEQTTVDAVEMQCVVARVMLLLVTRRDF